MVKRNRYERGLEMKRIAIVWAIIILLSIFLGACQSKGEETKNDTEVEKGQLLQVYTTIFPLMDFTKKIGGSYVEVKSLIPVGADAHSFEPTPKTMVEVSNADLFIYNGAGIEGFADAAVEVLKTGNVKILRASDGIDLINYDEEDGHEHNDVKDAHEHDNVHGQEEDNHADEHSQEEHGHDDGHDHDSEKHEDEDHHEHGEQDPHVWLDPIRSIQMAENIKNALVQLLPEGADEFEANFITLKGQLEALDETFKATLQDVNKDTIVVSHAGYGYWTDRYGIKQVGISGISPTNEPSIRQLQEVIELMQEKNLRHVLFEQNIPTAIAETVRSQVKAEALWLHNLESLTQADITKNEDYFSLMERNIETLRIALQ